MASKVKSKTLPITVSSNILFFRFDFGVPLEDVFPPRDIHPRLKVSKNIIQMTI